MDYYNLPFEQVAQQFKVDLSAGLSEKEAQRRLEQYGPNRIIEVKKESLLIKFLKFFVEPMALLLVAASLISFLIKSYLDGWVILGIVFLNSLIGFVQEYRAERIMAALKKLVPQKALVMRQGKLKEVFSWQIVPGDILVLQEGEDIPADARLIEAYNLATNDALLTGESTPQPKTTNLIPHKDLPYSEIDNMVFMGTNVARGSGKAIVVATGPKTKFNSLVRSIQEVKEPPSSLQKELSFLGRQVSWAALLIMVFVLIFNLFLKRPLASTLIFSIALGVALVPEGLPTALTISLALGMQRLAKRHALVRKLSAVEALGALTVVCVDKTGTLTEGEMMVERIWFPEQEIRVEGQGYQPQGDFWAAGRKLKSQDLLAKRIFFEIAALCNSSELRWENNHWQVIGDPTEGALLALVQKAGFDWSKLRGQYQKVAEFPFTSERKMMSVCYQDSQGQIKSFVKGSPEKILALANQIFLGGEKRPLDQELKSKIKAKIDQYASEALRLLALAYRDLGKDCLKKEGDFKKAEENLVLVGLVGLVDPPRSQVKKALLECQKAGIKVIMVTGDYETTALAVARRIGLVQGLPLVINHQQLVKMSKSQLKECLAKEVIFARIDPQDKLRIVEALQEMDHRVAMTGDGVNDVPALQKADIGIAMGQGGTDAAREASEMILLDNSFESIVAAIKGGREIYENLKKTTYYNFSSNATELFTNLLALLIGLPFPLFPLQILTIDLGTDVFPSLALGIDTSEIEVMAQPPRHPQARLADRNFWSWLIFVGLVVSGPVVLFYLYYLLSHGWWWGQEIGLPVYYLKVTTFTYVTLILSQFVVAFQIRDLKKSFFKTKILANRFLSASIAFSTLLLVVFVYSPFFQKILHTFSLTIFELAWSLIFVLLLFGAIEIKKYFSRRPDGVLESLAKKKVN